LGTLSPFIPLPLEKGKGEGLVLKGFHLFNLPYLTKERGKILEEGRSPSQTPGKHVQELHLS